MFDTEFKSTVKNSFSKAKQEIEGLKLNMDEWLLYLQKQNQGLQSRVLELEDRLKTLEKRELLHKII